MISPPIHSPVCQFRFSFEDVKEKLSNSPPAPGSWGLTSLADSQAVVGRGRGCRVAEVLAVVELMGSATVSPAIMARSSPGLQAIAVVISCLVPPRRQLSQQTPGPSAGSPVIIVLSESSETVPWFPPATEQGWRRAVGP
ncbi:hypothetical protein AAFF_G00161070 [Aldrovandia affinis]|uniref:Uncharacterized protein n=1 Tax=Aldrovandia affinis TaxID=143900 RepID=A0AAD7RMI6_9TELE|nr:hypothetical protein AAFF_G00161070 [Aldrovandia affinis]